MGSCTNDEIMDTKFKVQREDSAGSLDNEEGEIWDQLASLKMKPSKGTRRQEKVVCFIILNEILYQKEN